MEVTNGSTRYRVGSLVADNGRYRIYTCNRDDTVCQGLLQISTSVEHNGGLDREAYILGELKCKSDELEEAYAKVKTNPESWLNYDLGFPRVVDSFICAEQGGRRINILAFRNVEDVSRLVPLDNLTSKDRLRIDLRTSVWPMGKALKLLTFAHSEGITVGLMTGSNILIEPNEHYVVIFDWSLAKTAASSDVPKDDQRKDITEAARAVVTAIGGDMEEGIFPNEDDANRTFTDYLLWLAKGNASSAETAHRRFYELADSIWPRKYHPFTTLPLDY